MSGESILPQRLLGNAAVTRSGKLTFCTMIAGIVYLFSMLFPFVAGAETVKITGYRPMFKPCYNASGELQVAVRSYHADSVAFCLLVNPLTLEASTAGAATLNFSKGISRDTLAATPFARALKRYTSPPYRLQNHGVSRADHPVAGLFLTVDMCPSKRPFEKELFVAAGRLPNRRGAVPLAVAMTGAWLKDHPDELAWLRREIEDGRLAVTWVNHSLTHPYEPGVPLERNFLLKPGVEFDREVLATEVLLLEKGLTPAPFFRFPGLVANGKLLERLRELSLIPLGSDAWLAKGEKPVDGSFILVHGNGNEPKGIVRALPLLAGHEMRLLPLRMAIDGVAR